MKVSIYRTVLDSSRYPCLVAEKGKRYVCDGRKKFDNPDIIYDFCVRELGLDTAAEEYVYIFALDSAMHLCGVFEATHGTVNVSLVGRREIFQKLLLLGAVNFIMVHNHPSGDPTPSDADVTIHKKLNECGALMEISQVDNLIIGDGSYYSFRERGEVDG